MMLQEARLFVARFVKGDHTPDEYATFLRWLEKASTDELEVIAKEYEALFGDWDITPLAPSQEWVNQLESRLDLADGALGAEAPVIAMNRGRLIRRVIGRVAAASVVLAVGIGSYLLYNHQHSQPVSVADINTEALSNSFSVPRGGQQKLFTLPDGSLVWLNAASTLKYSTAGFSGTGRIVELNGEAYFSISKDAKLPFRIKTGRSVIEVLGTAFNVRAYADEPTSKTTLVSGSVKVIDGTEAVVLKPGEQAMVDYREGAGPIDVTPVENLDAISSWKDGIMEFKNEDLKSVMNQIARCYDMGVEFEEGAPTDRRFSGVLSRKATINQILIYLAHQGVHCKLNGNKIVVMR